MDESLEHANAQIASLDDDQMVRRMNRRTSVTTMVIGFILVAGCIGLGAVWFMREQAREARWDTYNRAQEEASNTSEFLDRIRPILASTEFDDVRIEILQKMGHYHDADSVSAIIPMLANAGPVRVEAARALGDIGAPAADQAKPQLLRALGEANNEAERAALAWTLAVLREDQAAEPIIAEFESGRLQHQEHPPFDPKVIVDVLGVSRLASQELTNHESVAVRTLVAQALAEVATPEVIQPLTRIIQDPQNRAQSDDNGHDEGRNVLRAAASGLGRIGDPAAARPLFDLMQSDPAMRASVLDALRRSTGARGLSVLLTTANDDQTKRDLTAMLRETHDPAAADGLATVLDTADEDIKIQAAQGLAELGDARAVPALLELAQHEDMQKGRDALDALRLLGSADAAPTLVRMLTDDRFANRRASTLLALGATRSQSAESSLLRALDSDDISSAALALAALDSNRGYTTLTRMIPRPADKNFAEHQGQSGVALQREFDNRTAAVRAIGRYGRPEAAPLLMTIIEDPQDDIRLRNDAGLALGAVANDEILSAVLSKVQQTELDDAARRFYLGALWQHPSRALSSPLMSLVRNTATPPDVRRPVAVAVGYTADPANDAQLLEMLNNPETERDAAIAIALGGDEAAAEALAAKIQENQDLRDVLQSSLMNETNDWFNLITQPLWDSGEVARRLRVAQILKDNDMSFAWMPLIARLRTGWDGPNGLSAREIRMRFAEQLRGDDAALRVQAAQLLGAMGETGLLMAARDEGGAGSDEARAVLREMNRARSEGSS